MTSSPLPAASSACWPVDLTCLTDWDATDVTTDAHVVPRYSEAVKEQAVAMAGETMRYLTGYSVGGCPITVRPCRESYVESTWQGPRGAFYPVLASGTWLNVGCGHRGECACTGLAEVRLGQASIVYSVMVDGVLLDPDAYRLDPGGRLVRLDGGVWPLAQRLDVADTEPGTWSVTYLPGVPVDAWGARAAARLAGEYVQACTGGQCGLPDAVVTQIARNGISMTVAAGLFPDGTTGIREVDLYVQRYNPHKLAAPSLVYSPDVHRHRRVATPARSYDGGRAPGGAVAVADGGREQLDYDGGTPDSDSTSIYDGGTP